MIWKCLKCGHEWNVMFINPLKGTAKCPKCGSRNTMDLYTYQKMRLIKPTASPARYCPYCGAPITPEAEYCPNCGKKVR